MAKDNGLPKGFVEQFNKVCSMVEGLERKGKGSPYTSMNGNMYTMMRKDGTLGIRLSKEQRESFKESYETVDFENYGSMIREYVEVPEEVFMNTDLMVFYLKMSHDYAKTLKPKATKKATKKKASAKEPVKVTALLGQTYKNGQIKSELKGDQLYSYFEDGSIKDFGKVIDEKKEGKWTFNRKGGQLLQVGHFTADVKDGEFIRYDSNDKIAYHVIFEKGKVKEKLY